MGGKYCEEGDVEMSECDCPLCKNSLRNCPKCGAQLTKGKTVKEKDGTEYFELKCPKCNERYMDVKVPYSAMGTSGMAEGG